MLTTDSLGWHQHLAPSTDSPGFADSDRIDLWLGGIHCQPDPWRIPAPGEYFIYIDELEGWDDYAPDETSRQQHWSGDGTVPGMPRRGARSIKLTMHIFGHDPHGPGSTRAAIERLRRVENTTLRVWDAALQLFREADVRTVDFKVEHDSPFDATVDMLLVADDPLRYNSGTIRVWKGVTRLPNRGNRRAWPLIESAGPVNLTFQHGGGILSVQVQAGKHIIDNRAGCVWNASGQRVHGIASGPWLSIAPGGGMVETVGLVNGNVRVTRWEAWS